MKKLFPSLCWQITEWDMVRTEFKRPVSGNEGKVGVENAPDVGSSGLLVGLRPEAMLPPIP